MPLSYIRRAQVFALTAACLVHAGLIFWLFWPVQGNAAPMEQLAVMDFLSYDPNEGEPSSGKGKDPVSPSQDEVKPEPETVPEPEPEKEMKMVESVSEKAEENYTPPPEPKKKPTPRKPKPKPAHPAPAPSAPSSQAASGGPGGVTRPGGSGRGGMGGGTGIGTSDAGKAYLSHIVYKLNRYKKYPAAAKAKRLAGVVTMHFVVNSQGGVVSSRMVKSSGEQMLDEEAKALVWRVSPFKPIPPEVGQNSLSLTVPIRFDVR